MELDIQMEEDQISLYDSEDLLSQIDIKDEGGKIGSGRAHRGGCCLGVGTGDLFISGHPQAPGELFIDTQGCQDGGGLACGSYTQGGILCTQDGEAGIELFKPTDCFGSQPHGVGPGAPQDDGQGYFVAATGIGT